MLATALNKATRERLGYEKRDPAGVGTGIISNGRRAGDADRTIGPVELDMPRDRAATFKAADMASSPYTKGLLSV
jgi:putative transposase